MKRLIYIATLLFLLCIGLNSCGSATYTETEYYPTTRVYLGYPRVYYYNYGGRYYYSRPHYYYGHGHRPLYRNNNSSRVAPNRSRRGNARPTQPRQRRTR